jgi:hypothetical protein
LNRGEFSYSYKGSPVVRHALVVVLRAVVGCGNRGSPVPIPAPGKSWSGDEQKAVAAAAQWLKEGDIDWGAPESVKLADDKKTYWVTVCDSGG